MFHNSPTELDFEQAIDLFREIVNDPTASSRQAAAYMGLWHVPEQYIIPGWIPQADVEAAAEQYVAEQVAR